MQQRVPVKHYSTHEEALKDKTDLKTRNPDINYQIRRKHNGFDLVRRFSVNEIKSHEESYDKKRRGPGKRKRSKISEAFLSEVRSKT